MLIGTLQIPHYDIARGMEFVALWTSVIFGAVLFLGWRSQYRLMNTYDALNSFVPSKERHIQVTIAHVKRIIFSVLGYQGEEREREALDQLDHRWVLRNFRTIIGRFCIFYFVYIWALILTTRALQIDPGTGAVQVINYTSKQLFGFMMIGLYILSNSLFDILSIFFTLKHLERLRQDPRMSVAFVQLAKTLGYCMIFFLASQLVSNLIWPLKTNIDVSIVDRILSPAIPLWPYAFILDAGSGSVQYLPFVFPGQLLITGTVFLPVVLVAMLFVVWAITIHVAGLVKIRLVAHDLAQVGFIVSTSPSGETSYRFQCLNAASIGVVSAIIGTTIYEWGKHVILSF
jgi:hypothetical protein